MRKSILFVTIILIVTGCSSFTQTAWNSPFINSKDIVKLEFGMTKNSVLENMPQAPLYVESGNSETTVWVYNVRTVKVKSVNNSDGTVTPQKMQSTIKHQSEIDNLYLTFNVNNKLLAWGPKPYDPNYIAPYYDCAGECNGDAYIDDCGLCNGATADNETTDDNDSDEGSFKLQLNVEGTQEPDGTLIIKGGN